LGVDGSHVAHPPRNHAFRCFPVDQYRGLCQQLRLPLNLAQSASPSIREPAWPLLVCLTQRAPFMTQNLESAKQAWPSLKHAEMRNLLAYLRQGK
jgi:hypothetical protein